MLMYCVGQVPSAMTDYIGVTTLPPAKMSSLASPGISVESVQCAALKTPWVSTPSYYSLTPPDKSNKPGLPPCAAGAKTSMPLPLSG